MGFDLVEFVKANLKAVVIAVAVFFASAWINPYKAYGIIPLVLASGAFIAAKRFLK